MLKLVEASRFINLFIQVLPLHCASCMLRFQALLQPNSSPVRTSVYTSRSECHATHTNVPCLHTCLPGTTFSFSYPLSECVFDTNMLDKHIYVQIHPHRHTQLQTHTLGIRPLNNNRFTYARHLYLNVCTLQALTHTLTP